MLILRDCMSAPVISVSATATVEEAAKVMAENDISAVFIKGDEDYIGIFTNTDMVKRVIARGLDPKVTVAASVASQPVLTIDMCLSTEEANEKMLRHKVKRIAVTEGKKIVGVISVRDIVRF